MASLTEQHIDQLLTPEVRATAARLLAGLPNGVERDPNAFNSLYSWTQLFPTAAGPLGGYGAAVPTWMRWTILHSGDAMMVFLNDLLYGVGPYRPNVISRKDMHEAGAQFVTVWQGRSSAEKSRT